MLVVLCLLSLFGWELHAQPGAENLNHLLENSEIGKTYALFPASKSEAAVVESSSYYLKLIPPKFRHVKDTIVLCPALNEDLDTSNYFIQTEVLVLRDKSTEWKRAKIADVCVEERPEESLVLLKSLPHYRIVNRKFYPFKEVLDTSEAEKVIPADVMIVGRSELVEDGRIELFSSASAAKLKPGEKLIKVPAGSWTHWREVVCPYGVFNRPNLSKVQRFLKDQGYDVTIDNSYGPKTKQAIHEYQRKNGLSVGDLNDATYEHMGLSGEKLISIEH